MNNTPVTWEVTWESYETYETEEHSESFDNVEAAKAHAEAVYGLITPKNSDGDTLGLYLDNEGNKFFAVVSYDY